MGHSYRALGAKQPNGSWLLATEEAHHVLKVLRMNDGASLEVFDGAGTVALGVIESHTKISVAIRVEVENTIPPDKSRLICLLGALKPGEVDDIIPGLVEVGVSEIRVFGQQGSNKGHYTDKVQQRWQQIMVNACKQSKRAWLVAISWHDQLKVAAQGLGGGGIYLDGGGKTPQDLGLTSYLGAHLAYVVGSERGLTEMDIQFLKSNGFNPMRLGPHVLRAKTAALVGGATLAMILP